MGDFWKDLADFGKASVPFIGAGLDFFGGLLTNSQNAAEAARNRRFVAAMYKKRYQNTVADMRKAGLNPILASMNGGAVGSVPSPGGLPSFENAFGSAAHTALSVAQGMSGIRKTDADTSRSEASTKSINQDIISKTIKNKYLEPQEEAMVKDAIARATNNAALAELNSARAEHAQFLADSEANIAASNRDIAAERAGAGRYDTMRKAREYEIMPKGKEGIFWDRLDRASKAVGRGVNSALGLGKLKALSRAIR